MALIPGTLVKADNALDRAVRNALSEKFYTIGERKEPGYTRSALTASPIVSANGGTYKYQGYFTIEDASEKDESGNITAYKVKVWDPRTPSQSQPCYVNGVVTYFGSWTSGELSSGKTFIRLHFTAPQPSSGTVGSNDYVPATSASVVIESARTATPSDTADNVYYQLGFVEIDSNGEMTIYQDHVIGIVRMIWLSNCGT